MALGEVISTLKDIKSFRTLFFYMLAYFCFIDGINSVTALAGVFGIVVLGLTTTGLILTIVIIQSLRPCCDWIYEIGRQMGHQESTAIFSSLLVCSDYRSTIFRTFGIRKARRI